MWRMAEVVMGLLRHDREVEGVVVEDDAVLVQSIRGRARYAQSHVPKRRSHHLAVVSIKNQLSRLHTTKFSERKVNRRWP